MSGLTETLLMDSSVEGFSLQRSSMTNDNVLVFDSPNGFNKALSQGFFLVKVPEGINLESGDCFAENFYKEKDNNSQFLDRYKGFKIYTPDKFNTPHEGYYLRDVDQVEQFFLEQRYWGKIYPSELVHLAEQLNELAFAILVNVLSYLSIPEKYWGQATGEYLNNNGTVHLTFNHFRGEKEASRGLNVHKDSGWVTILRSIEPGLEAFIDNQWRKIKPEDGYFIVNFGCAMEILTANLEKPVSAVIHRVVKQAYNPLKPDRFSYALFTDNSLDETVCAGLYSYDRKDNLTLKMNFRRFLDEILAATYTEDTVGLY